LLFSPILFTLLSLALYFIFFVDLLFIFFEQTSGNYTTSDGICTRLLFFNYTGRADRRPERVNTGRASTITSRARESQ